MNREERERMERRQRMLAREQGTPAPTPDAPAAPEPRAAAPKAPPRPNKTAPAAPPPNVKPLSPLLRRRQRRRRIFWTALVLAAAIAVAVLTGAFSTSLAMLGDLADSVYLSLDHTGGTYPASTGIPSPTQIQSLAGGFVEMDGEDLAVYSAHGGKIRSIQHGYARPALAVGNTHFAIYNRAGTELRIESRTRNLYTESFTQGILLCAMSQNGTLAVVTESDRYAAELRVYDPSFNQTYIWQMTQTEGTPIALDFATDNRRFAAGTVSAKQGQLASAVYFMDVGTAAEGPVYIADAGNMLLKLQWLSPKQVLAVFDTYTALLNAADGTEAARYDYGGASLQSVAVGGKNTVLLLASRSGNSMVALDESLAPLAVVSAGQAVRVDCSETKIYLLDASTVACYGFDGAKNWTKTLTTAPLAVLSTAETLLFTSSGAEILTAPGA